MFLWRIYCKVILMVKYKYTYFGIQLSFKNHSTILNYFSKGAFIKVFRFLFSFYFNQLFFRTVFILTNIQMYRVWYFMVRVISKLQYKQWNIFDFFGIQELFSWKHNSAFTHVLIYSFTGTVFNHTFLMQ